VEKEMNLELRQDQIASVEELRAWLRTREPGQNKRQLLYGPTGSGKTVIATYLMQEASAKLSRAAFIVDRVSLIDQTSRTFDEYGIAHGVIQANHWRAKPWERIQVCSAQTLARREFPGELNLIIVDECHTMYKGTVDFIKANRGVAVLGLTATPFAKGMGSVYTNVVNVTTTDKLVEEGFLAPHKAYAAKRMDMTGARVNSYGEWNDQDVEKRGLAIVGDVVEGWIQKTNEHFGGPKKTIVFSATVAHGEELCRQFQAAGFNFQQVSYKDGSDGKRAELIDEFRKPNSQIVGLISCEALAKGFDVPDIFVRHLVPPVSEITLRPYPITGSGTAAQPRERLCPVAGSRRQL
jgi:DNA repair protein RadD